jgi:hypothetical protein
MGLPASASNWRRRSSQLGGRSCSIVIVLANVGSCWRPCWRCCRCRSGSCCRGGCRGRSVVALAGGGCERLRVGLAFAASGWKKPQRVEVSGRLLAAAGSRMRSFLHCRKQAQTVHFCSARRQEQPKRPRLPFNWQFELRAQPQHLDIFVVFWRQRGGCVACDTSVWFCVGIASCVGLVLDGWRVVVRTKGHTATRRLVSSLSTLPTASADPANVLPRRASATQLPLTMGGSQPCNTSSSRSSCSTRLD